MKTCRAAERCELRLAPMDDREVRQPRRILRCSPYLLRRTELITKSPSAGEEPERGSPYHAGFRAHCNGL